VLDLRTQSKANERQLRDIVLQVAPDLLAMLGVGPVTAAVVIVAWSRRGRVRSEAAFPALAGTCPIPVSSGNTKRHRLNRGGDRRLNGANHTIAT
jgi:transposase